MAEIWPATLPQYILVEGHGAGFGDGRLRSPMDMGPAKIRLRSSAIPKPLSGSMVMTLDQIDGDLTTFVETTTLGGSQPFFLPAQSEAGGADLLCRFAELPTWSAIGDGKFRVTIQLEILP